MGLFGDLYKQADAGLGGILPGAYSTKDVSAKEAFQTLALSPLTGLYAIGGGLNQLTGGTTTAWTPGAAIVGGVDGTTYSRATQFLSGYTAGTREAIPPGAGDWYLPVLNPQLPLALKDGVEFVVEDLLPPWLLPAAVGVGALWVLS